LIEALRNLDQQRCLHHICDIRKAEDCEKLIDAVLKRFLKLDILINNAGGQFPALAESITPRGFSAVITNNLVGTWNMLYYAGTKAFIPQQHGVVVNVIANVRNGFPTMSHTGAARAGVDNLTKSLAVEWARHHVRVNAVAPGIIESSGTTDKARYGEGMLERAAAVIPMRRVGTLREVTDCVLFLAGDGASFVTGQCVCVVCLCAQTKR
jgi:NAD(P)-dependent dehydrogenase (short-subunit alcohol dehydrogenase family)